MTAPWLSWLQRPTVSSKQSEGREFEPHWGSVSFAHCLETRVSVCIPALFLASSIPVSTSLKAMLVLLQNLVI